MNSDVWRTPQGQIGTEIERAATGRGDMVRLAIRDKDGFPIVVWFAEDSLTREVSRYEGARGGRVSG